MHASETPPLRVLVVEDCPDTAESLRLLCGLWGYETRVAYTGPDALQAAADFRPDAVLLDINLPGGMSGLEVARRLREAPSPALVVAVTGRAGIADRERMSESGIHCLLLKPADAADLRILLDSSADRARGAGPRR